MLPATLDDLLTDAECNTALLIAGRPSIGALALGWPRFTDSSQRLLTEALRASTADPFEEATRAAIQTARWTGRVRRLWLDALPETSAPLRHVTDLLDAATDLLARQPYVTSDTTRAVAVRTAGVIAGVSYATATAERQRHHEPMGLHAIRLQLAAARMLDLQRGHSSSGHMTSITAEPLSADGALSGAGPRFQAAALAWNRAAADPSPSNQTFGLAALTLATSTAYVWKLLERAKPEVAEAEKARFVQTHQSWRHVASLWREYTTATPAPVEHRALAAEVVQAAQALSDGVRDLSSPERAQRLAAAGHGLRQLHALAQAHRQTVDTLLRAGAVYVPTGTLRTSRVQIVGRARPRLGSCPREAALPLIEAIQDGLRRLQGAAATVPQTKRAFDVPTTGRWAGEIARRPGVSF